MKVGDLMEEDSTNYGEFISSYFAWLTLEKQKNEAEKLENITKKQKNLPEKLVFAEIFDIIFI